MYIYIYTSVYSIAAYVYWFLDYHCLILALMHRPGDWHSQLPLTDRQSLYPFIPCSNFRATL